MNTDLIKESFTKAMANTKLIFKSYSPEIYLGIGIASGAAAIITACIASTKIKDKIKEPMEEVTYFHDETKHYKDRIAHDKVYTPEKMAEELKMPYDDVETPEAFNRYMKDTASQNIRLYQDARKGLAKSYGKTAKTVLKLYAIPVSLSVISVSTILVSHGIIRQRNATLSAAYTLLNKTFEDYRQRVREKHGEEADENFRYGLENAKKTETETDPETGKEKKKTKTVKVYNDEHSSDFIYVIDKHNPFWEKSASYTRMQLELHQGYMNDIYESQGYMFLSDVCKDLMLPISKKSQICGWKKGRGDEGINFRIKESYKNNEFGELEPVFLLDFNVDGVILDCFED